MKLVLITLGLLSLGLGVIGIFLPLLPTTPFLILSAICFSRSSRRLHQWLYAHPTLGPLLNHWERERAIPLRAKVLASLMMLLSLLTSYGVFKLPWGVLILLALLFSLILAYIWTRATPSQE